MRYMKEVLDSRELLANLTLREIRGQYKRTIFGQLWSLVNPLATMLVYTIVFAFILRVTPPPGNPSGLNIFAVWLLCGLLPWAFFANVVQTGMGSIIANAGLVQKVYFSRIVLPLSTVGSIGYNWLFEMGVLVLVLAICGSFVWPWIPLVIFVMVLLAIFASGLALMLSVANVRFRDTQYLVSIVMQIWMYLTPIIYPISLVEDQSRAHGGLFGTSITLMDIYRLNPLERFVAVFRQLLYDNTWPNPQDLLFCAVWAFAAIVVGVWVFRKSEKGLAEAL
ncbi:ABC transporter permease [Cryobacterium sp. MDB2-10]|uniref:Transport permease protein n=2 Tax=Microbacteriaceae TaxID=85023 RepID=A0ABY2IKS7_9MICO|nr:ABC transporter permease [Cryobacterium sp. MDB2-A-1]TFC10938.1 ABC transporter permease [Cryobacterium sp. MDB2-A-2]TFC14415.1 ABC transporter permease [Cryobacterium sp. MDB2-10]TFC19379.1 ABC transporter permease [Cryobacterium glucosi]